MNRYCDYDVIIYYNSDEFASRYAEKLEGKLKLIKQEKLDAEQIETFFNRKYETYISCETIVMYRLYGKYQKNEPRPRGVTASGAGHNSRFVSTEFVESVIDARMRLALNLKWKNTQIFEAKLIVPSGTTINVGIVAPVVLPTGAVLPGGAPQIMLPPGWPEKWI